MILQECKLPGLFLIHNKKFCDDRGSFVKTFNSAIFTEASLNPSFQESFYSTSKKDVIRGMHFQIPPDDHDKMVCVLRGSVMDVVLDLRISSKTYGQYESFFLSEENNQALYIPTGVAHGFKSLEDNTVMIYNVTSVHSPQCESGVHWNSFGCPWKIDNPIVSERDRALISFQKFQSPFE